MFLLCLCFALLSCLFCSSRVFRVFGCLLFNYVWPLVTVECLLFDGVFILWCSCVIHLIMYALLWLVVACLLCVELRPSLCVFCLFVCFRLHVGGPLCFVCVVCLMMCFLMCVCVDVRLVCRC